MWEFLSSDRVRPSCRAARGENVGRRRDSGVVLEDDSRVVRRGRCARRDVSYLRYVIKIAWNAWRRYWFDLVIVGIAILAAVEVAFRLDDSNGQLTRPDLAVRARGRRSWSSRLLARRRLPVRCPCAVFVVGVAGSVVERDARHVHVRQLRRRSRRDLPVRNALPARAIADRARHRSRGRGVRRPQRSTQGLGDFAFIAFVFTVAWLAGLALGSQLTAAARAIERAEHLEREREAEARAAVAEERARIARELHDVVGHSVSVMTVQASAVRRLLTPEQEREREALLIVEQTGREALAEMRRLVGVLRRPEEAPALVPQPSLEHVEKLVEQTREAGLPTQLNVEGEASPLPAGIDLTAYRLVQEGLTNALKHANATHAEVLVRYEADARRARRPRQRHRRRQRRRQRARARRHARARVGLRRQLEAGRAARGGYELRARLPVARRVSVRVLIVDDQALVRTGFRMILEAEPDIEVVGEAGDGAQAIDEVRRLEPDVVLMDVRMPELDGIEATRRLLANGGRRRRRS